jgi:beta-N-acetylhexosaminidase
MTFLNKNYDFDKTPENIDNCAGQLLVAGFDGSRYTKDIGRLFKKLKVAGVILFARNIKNRQQVKNLISDIFKVSEDETGLPPFICIDQEGGRVSRLSEDFPRFPSSAELAFDGSCELVYKNYLQIGRVLSETGFNVDFAPVLDLSTNKKSPVIGDRAFSDNPELAGKMGLEAMRGLSDGHILNCAKHFPGHGDTDLDSHKDLPTDDRSRERLLENEISPFAKACENGVDMVMTAHVIYRAFDDRFPATLSRSIITDLLREKLGYDGIVVSDDFDMSALAGRWDETESVTLAMKAGVDLFLVCHQSPRIDKVHSALRRAIEGEKELYDSISTKIGRIMIPKKKIAEYMGER